MLRNFLAVDEGRHHNMGRFLKDLDYVLIVKVDARHPTRPRRMARLADIADRGGRQDVKAAA